MRSGRRIGLLGGSFNPAHAGHRHISLLALKTLALDEVWWLVSPQNPLKSRDGMAPMAARLASARTIARHPRIHPTDLESRLGTRFTADTLRLLKRRRPGVRFVWIMGADNLGQIHRWQRWIEIFRLVPVAVFDRPTYCYPALAGRAAQRFRAFRRPGAAASGLASRKPPAWCFVAAARHPASATEIRQRRDGRTEASPTEAGPTSAGATT